MSIAVNGYTGARSGTGLLVTAAVHVALGAALLSLGVVELKPLVTPPIKIIKVPPTPTPVEEVEPAVVDEPVDLPYQPPIIDIFDDPLPREPLVTTVDRRPLADPQPSGTGGEIAPVPKRADPMLVTARLDPRYAGRFQPPYPAASERQEEEGVVVVRVRVGTDGRVLAAELQTSSGHRRLDETAVEHAKRAWRFTPATRDGVAVESWRVIPVRFELKNG